MARKQDNAKQVNWKEVIGEQEDFLRPLIREVIQQVLEAEMEEAVSAEKSERTPDRQGYRAGYYGRTLVTRVGKLELRVPQDRQGRFRTEVFERYQRSEKALVGALTEMYVQGVSTRKVRAVTEQLCGHEFSASTISRMNQSLDKELDKFATRGLEEPYPYLIVDARYEKVREDGVHSQPGGDGCDRHRLGRPAMCAGCGTGQSRITNNLERIPYRSETARFARGGTGGQ
jgi:transposase-like protein